MKLNCEQGKDTLADLAISMGEMTRLIICHNEDPEARFKVARALFQKKRNNFTPSVRHLHYLNPEFSEYLCLQ